ncbi:MAG TPA: hypothetical protein VER55_06925 [Ardenticatenaceae bacterium]|nr:hypothetical protein [Ardenticatenaceae bacterium]
MKTIQTIALLLLLLLLAACGNTPQTGNDPTAPATTVSEATEPAATAEAPATATTEALPTHPAEPEASPTTAPTRTTEAAPTEPVAEEAPTTEAEATEPTEDTPTTEAGATEEATPAAGETAAGFCPEVSRPALILFIPGQKYVVTNPVSGESCDLPFPDDLPGILQVANGELYYHIAEGDNLIVRRLSPDGTAETLDFTAVDKVERSLYHTFAVSPDGRYIAWTAAGTKVDDPESTVSELWVAEIETGEVTAHIEEFSTPEEGRRSLEAIRFDDTGALFYSRAPIGLGGAWTSFTGRYDNLFVTPASGGVITPVFDCASQGLFLCLGDFYAYQGQAQTIAYTNDQTSELVILNGEGDVLNTLASDGEYIGYPTIDNATGEMVYYSADLAEDGITPERATLYRVAPPTAPAEAVAGDPAMLLPQRFLDGSHVVVGYVSAEGIWGHAVVDLMNQTLQPLSEWPDAVAVGVLPQVFPATP